MRKYYIDNIRILCILLLFPYHTFMFFNTFGEPFYVFSKPIKFLSGIDIMIYPWWMDLLFVVAGISTAFSLKKRSAGQYANERFTKLLLPFIFGLLLLIPIQCFIADVFHNGYNGGYFKHYSVFFTRFTDLSGYDGGFTPAHTWFMLYLYVISMVTLPVLLWYNKRKNKINGSRITMPVILTMIIPLMMMSPLLNIGGKSIGESLACFLLGYFILSQEEALERLVKYRFPLAAAWVILMAVREVAFVTEHLSGIVWDIQYMMLTWAGILAILGLGRKYLNFNNKFTSYFSPAAFPLYFFHQTVMVVAAFFVLKITGIVPLQIILILTASFALTILCYELFRRFTVTCFLFGIKKKEVNR